MFFHEPANISPDQRIPPNFTRTDEMTELTVLLPGQQALALEEAAHQDGLTTAQFLRRLISQAIRFAAARQA